MASANEARSNSVKQLCDLYRVVIAIAVGIAFQSIIDTQTRPIPIKTEMLLTFFAFMLTIIPFFHGAVRHLFATYVEDGGSTRIQNWAVLVDYYLLFIGGGLFVGLASTVGVTQSFLALFALVLGLDCVWGLLASVGFAGSFSQKAEIRWAAINFVTVSVVLLVIIFVPIMLNQGLTDTHIQVLILIVATVRTAVDYALNHRFYCP